MDNIDKIVDDIEQKYITLPKDGYKEIRTGTVFDEEVKYKVLKGDLLYAVDKFGFLLTTNKSFDSIVRANSHDLLKRCLDDLKKELERKQKSEINKAVKEAMLKAFEGLIKKVAKAESEAQ